MHARRKNQTVRPVRRGRATSSSDSGSRGSSRSQRLLPTNRSRTTLPSTLSLSPPMPPLGGMQEETKEEEEEAVEAAPKDLTILNPDDPTYTVPSNVEEMGTTTTATTTGRW